MRKAFRNLFVISFLVSLILHFSSVIYVYLKDTSNKQESVEVVFVDKKEMDALKKKAQENKATQVVEQSEKQLNNEIDEKAKYLSRFNQKVVRETRAANSGKFQNEAHQGLAAKSDAQNLNQQEKPKQSTTAEKLQVRKKAEPINPDNTGLPKLAKLMPKFEWNKNKSGVENPGPASQTDDHLKDVQTGAETLLSSREFVYYAYYSRIKDRLRLYWEPKIKEKMNRIFAAGRKIASDEDRITKLVIILDQGGKLVKVQVLSESGLKDLDDAAIEAFQAAAPFPNPPQGIVEPDGTIKIRWDFVIEAENDAFKNRKKNSYALRH